MEDHKQTMFENKGAGRKDFKMMIILTMIIIFLGMILQFFMYTEFAFSLSWFKGEFTQGRDGFRIPIDNLLTGLNAITIIYGVGQVGKSVLSTAGKDKGIRDTVPVYKLKTMWFLMICWVLIILLSFILQIISGSVSDIFGAEVAVGGFVASITSYAAALNGNRLTEDISLDLSKYNPKNILKNKDLSKGDGNASPNMDIPEQYDETEIIAN